MKPLELNTVLGHASRGDLSRKTKEEFRETEAGDWTESE
ncbi:hypothetical protein BDK88_1589 [Natrinema hispanicum]|uniref:Uncharacterized protein n=1 Tax=Natrinema hispanicum TaxID=392421 RepID=A0A482YCS6_9EURY|nr:hypothetical protein BDK88_1589 [Natrinema hispanicum]